jgi:uncharacterized membrane protein YdjX (TVP38/TMEM64 family)
LGKVIQINTQVETPKTTTPGHISWPKLVISIIGILLISFGIAFLLQKLIDKYNLPLFQYAWLAYLIVFVTSLVCNLTILAPVPIAASIMITAALYWNPVIIAACAAIGGTIGELSGYYAGYLEKKIAIPDSLLGYKRLEKWIQKYGFWAIFILALQPVIPFDVGGFIAGIMKMPLKKFLPALLAGKFPKYIIICYSAVGIVHFIPRSFL